MGKTIKISPIQKTYSAAFKTMESALAEKGYTRTPGTKRYFMPKKEADGRYRTGLDEKALYLNKLSEEEKEAELKFIKEAKTRLLENYPDIDFGPRSAVWNPFADVDRKGNALEVKVSPIPLGTDSIILSPDDDITQLLTYVWLRVDKDIARSLESYQRGECPECQYYLANDEAENKLVYSKKKEINRAISKFESLPPTKKKQLARLMGLPVSDSTTEEAVYNMVDNTLKEGEFKAGDFKSLSTVKIFNELAALADDRLAIKDLIEQAIRHNIYRLRGDEILEGTEVTSASKDALVEHLLDDKNQKERIALEVKVKNKKILVS